MTLDTRRWPALEVATRPGQAPPDPLEERLLLALDDLDALALEEADDLGGWRVYFSEGTARDRARISLEATLGTHLEITSIDVEDEGWATKVQQDLRAVSVGRLVIAPPWDVPSAYGDTPPSGVLETGQPPALPQEGSSLGVIVIEPSMGFGTGHHQSTRLCLGALQQLPLDGTRLVDVGTGSGVLALAALRLGAGEVVALDNDPDSVAAARANARLNGLANAMDIRLADLAAIAVEPADVVTANLTASLLRRHAGALVGLVRPGGRLVVSGFTTSQVGLVEDTFSGFIVETRHDEDDWVGLTFRAPPAR